MSFLNKLLFNRYTINCFVLKEDFTHKHDLLKNENFENKFVKVKDGFITVKAGYAWDGCTPNLSVFGLFVIGTPNGTTHLGKPWLYNVSLVHDALCQFRENLNLSHKETTQIFYDHMKEVKWPLKYIYYLGVKYLSSKKGFKKK